MESPGRRHLRVQVADLHDRGGEAFRYVLLAEAARPDFTVACDPDMINVGPGGRVPVFVRVARRKGFSGAVTLSWEALAAGRLGEPAHDLTRDDRRRDRGLGGHGRQARQRRSSLSTGPARAATDRSCGTAAPLEEIYLPGGGRGHYPVETLALAVTDPSDITVEATPREVVLAPGESIPLDVTVTRNAALRARRQPGGRAAASRRHPRQPVAAGRDSQGGRQQDPARPQGDQGQDHPPGRRRRARLRKSPDRRDGPRLDQLRGQDRVLQQADPRDGPAEGEGTMTTTCTAVSSWRPPFAAAWTRPPGRVSTMSMILRQVHRPEDVVKIGTDAEHHDLALAAVDSVA